MKRSSQAKPKRAFTLIELLVVNVSTPDNPDMLWMQEHSSDLVKR
ncbi:MAG: type II secretion system protein [Verrucomicrobia bacterium]|nr:type II secretion system protein [Verrucomicrobiota bacterium]